MPWDPIKLNDGRMMPSLVFGNGRTGKGQASIDQVEQAISLGFSHIDTAQNYRNEVEAGIAIRESGLARDEIFITTKYSGVNKLDIPTSIRDSLRNLGVAYVDLYLIHGPGILVTDIVTAWKQMEQLQREGLAKSIGVSNYYIEELTTLLPSAQVTPAVNQIAVSPVLYAQETAPVIPFCEQHNIAVIGFSPLEPLRSPPGGPLDAPLNNIGERLKASPSQVLLAWAKAKAGSVVTASSKKYRLEEYIKAGDIVLTPEDIDAIDKAGAASAGSKTRTAVTIIRRLVYAALTVTAAHEISKYLNLW